MLLPEDAVCHTYVPASYVLNWNTAYKHCKNILPPEKQNQYYVFKHHTCLLWSYKNQIIRKCYYIKYIWPSHNFGYFEFGYLYLLCCTYRSLGWHYIKYITLIQAHYIYYIQVSFEALTFYSRICHSTQLHMFSIV